MVLQLVDHADRARYWPFVARLRPPDDLAPAFERAGAPPILLRHADRGAPAAAVELARHVRRLGIDLIHVHSEPDRKVGQLAALLAGVPVVGHLHSPWPHLRPMHPEGAGAVLRRWSELKARARRLVEQRAVLHYVAVSDEVARFHRALVEAPIAVVDNGIDVQAFATGSDARSLARRALDIDDRAPLLVCVGRLAAGKGQDELIHVLSGIPDAHLVLLGDGEELGELQRLSRSLGVVDRVHFAGDRDDVAALLPAADLFVFASVSEGLPLSVLEAMASGLPVVAYDLPGLGMVITDGVEGCLVPPGDRHSLATAVAELLGDDRRRTAMASAARATVVERFDARRMTRGTEAVYDAVLGTAPERAGGSRVDDVVVT